MAANSVLPVFSAFEVGELASCGPRWRKWLRRFEVMLTAIGVKTDDEEDRRKDLLLHYVGEESFDIYLTLEEAGDTYDVVKGKLSDYFVPKSNPLYEKYVFRSTSQAEGEKLDEFCTRLKKLSVSCEFQSVQDEIVSQIVQGCTSTALRKKALQKAMALDELLSVGRSMELANTQLGAMEAKAVMYTRRESSGNFKKRDSSTKTSNAKCYKCGGQFPHDGECPALNRKCHACESYGHYSRYCKNHRESNESSVPRKEKSPKKKFRKNTNCVRDDTTTSDSDNSDCLFGVACNISEKLPTVKVKVANVCCGFIIDSGASVNVMDKNSFDKVLRKSDKVIELSKSNTKLYPYGSKVPLNIKGKFSADISNRTGNRINASFYVCEGTTGCLLSYDTAFALKVIKIVNAVDGSGIDIEDFLSEFKPLFQGVGKLEGFQLKLNIDESVPPVHQKHRRVPFQTRAKVESAILDLYKEGIIEPVENTPTPWVSPIVVVPRPRDPDRVRICVDMRAANKAIKRVKHVMPTLEELIHDLNGSKVFSKLDLSQGYHQIELAPESRSITTFSTHLGLHRYKRLNFGVNAASETFQHIIQQILQGIPGVKNVSDDVIIASRDIESHKVALRTCLQKLLDKGLTLNEKKCSFFQSSIGFYGNVFSEDGLSADPNKLSAICEAQAPKDKHEVRSLLGMVNYVQRYIPDLAILIAPIRELTKKDTDFVWDSMCKRAWSELKNRLSSATVMAYFDPNLKTELIVDASPCGLGAILTQVHTTSSSRNFSKVVSYASRSLGDVESRYSQIEREALAVRWAVEHFHLYLSGLDFVVITDHKPLVNIFSNVLAKPSPRIERWCLRLQQYNFTVIYQPGVNNPADYISRHPLKSDSVKNEKVTEEYVNFVSEVSCPKAVTLQEIEKATKSDSLLQSLIKCLRDDGWHKYQYVDEIQRCKSISHELSVTESGIILRGTRIVIPTKFRKKMVILAHQGHQGLVKTKELLRTKVWFPGIDKLVDDVIKSCNACAAVVKDERLRPLQMSSLPDYPWQCVSVDFCGPFEGKDYCMVVIDEYSRFPVVEIISSTSSKQVIPILNKIFATHGNPEVLKSDNGPPFQSFEFQQFLEHFGIRHRRITPLWPRANAQAENFMKPLKKCIKSSIVEGKSWKCDIYKFLRNYRATPHLTTGKPPAELLFGNNIRVCLPEFRESVDDSCVRSRDDSAKQKQKFHFDNRNCRRPPIPVCVGDSVLMKRDQQSSKLSSTYDPRPMIVTDVKGTMVTAQSEDLGSKTRNVSLFKKFPDTKIIQSNDNEPTDESDSRPNNQDASDSPDVTPNSDSSPAVRQSRHRKPPDRFKDFDMS